MESGQEGPQLQTYSHPSSVTRRPHNPSYQGLEPPTSQKQEKDHIIVTVPGTPCESYFLLPPGVSPPPRPLLLLSRSPSITSKESGLSWTLGVVFCVRSGEPPLDPLSLHLPILSRTLDPWGARPLVRALENSWDFSTGHSSRDKTHG